MIEESLLCAPAPRSLRGRRFSPEQPLRIAIEAGTHSPWVSRVLEELGHEVLVANPRKIRLIYARASARATNRTPKTWLGWLEWTRSCSLYPLKHRGEDSQAHLAIIRSREALVGSRTQLINPQGMGSGQVVWGSSSQVLG